MRNKWQGSLILVFMLLANPGVANASTGIPAPVKVGNGCITPNQIVKVKNFTYICMNVNSRLNKWAIYTKPSTAQPNPIAQSGSKTGSVVTTCNPKIKSFGANFPTSFTDLYAKRSQITCDAWSKLNASLTAAAGQTSTLPPVEIDIGPNTHPQDPTKLELNSINSLFAAPGVFKKITVIYFDPTDMTWATDLARKLMGASEVQKQFLSEPNADPRGVPLIHCISNGPLNCDSGDAWVTSDGQAFLGLGVPDQPYGSIGNGMAIAAVEYYHSLLLNPYILNNSLQNASNSSNDQEALSAINNLPQWFGVSGESFVHLLETDANNYANYVNEIGQDLPNQAEDAKSNVQGIGDAYGSTFDLAWINRFMDISNAATKWRSNVIMNQVGYKLGTRLSEILVALKGPTVFVQMDAFMAQGKTFDQAFQSVFGVSWETAQPEMAKTLWDEYLHNY